MADGDGVSDSYVKKLGVLVGARLKRLLTHKQVKLDARARRVRDKDRGIPRSTIGSEDVKKCLLRQI